jgi:hypothetical protein
MLQYGDIGMLEFWIIFTHKITTKLAKEDMVNLSNVILRLQFRRSLMQNLKKKFP